MFTIEGEHFKSRAVLTWSGGKLTGDPFLVFYIKELIRLTKSWDDPAYGNVKIQIKDPVAVFLTAKRIMSRIEFIEGSIPPPPSMDEGAV